MSPTTASRKCGAKTRNGGTCRRQAGWGTSHLGYGNCSYHFGATTAGAKVAAKEAALVLAGELDMEPHEALLWTLRKAAGRVAYWSNIVAALRDDELVVESVRERVWSGGEGGGGQETVTTTHAELRLEYRALQEAEAELAKRAKMALDAGVQERQVRVIEQWGQQLAGVLAAVLDRLELSAAQRERAPEIVRAELRALEGGAAG